MLHGYFEISIIALIDKKAHRIIRKYKKIAPAMTIYLIKDNELIKINNLLLFHILHHPKTKSLALRLP